MASRTVATAVVAIQARTEQLRKKLEEARGDVKGFATDARKQLAKGFIDKPLFANLEKAGNKFKDLQRLTRKWTRQNRQLVATFRAIGRVGGRAFSGITKTIGIAGVAATAAAGGFALMVDHTSDAADQAGKAASKLGLTTKALQELRFAAGLVNVEQNTLDMGLQRFTRRVAEAARGGGEAKAALEELNIELFDANGRLRRADDLLLRVADAFENVRDPVDQVRLAFKLFDSEGVALVNLLKEGRSGIEAMGAQLEALGAVASETLVEQSGLWSDNKAKLALYGEGLRNTIAETVLPWLNAGAEGILDYVTSQDNIINEEVEQFLTRAAEAAERFIDAIGNKDGKTNIADLSAALDNLESSLGTIGDSLESVKEAADLLMPTFKAVASTTRAIGDILGFVTTSGSREMDEFLRELAIRGGPSETVNKELGIGGRREIERAQKEWFKSPEFIALINSLSKPPRGIGGPHGGEVPAPGEAEQPGGVGPARSPQAEAERAKKAIKELQERVRRLRQELDDLERAGLTSDSVAGPVRDELAAAEAELAGVVGQRPRGVRPTVQERNRFGEEATAIWRENRRIEEEIASLREAQASPEVIRQLTEALEENRREVERLTREFRQIGGKLLGDEPSEGEINGEARRASKNARLLVNKAVADAMGPTS